MQKSDNKLVIHNTFMLYIMNFAKFIFPVLTFPYLTRILSVDYYGLVVCVKRDDNDREYFINVLRCKKAENEFRFVAFCFMTNHI